MEGRKGKWDEFMLGDVWTRKQIGMQFQTGGGHGWDGVQEFVDYTHSLAFLKIKLVGFDEDRYW